MEIRTISDFRRAMRNGPRTWPGGYPLYFVCADGEALSFKAAREERRNILQALAYNDTRSGWFVVGVDVNLEDGELVCAHSGERIQSAYAD